MPEHYDYRGQYPALERYIDRFDKEEKRKETEQFLRERREAGAVFDFKVEMAAYLHADCRILAAGVVRLLKEWMTLQEELAEEPLEAPLHPLTPPYYTFSR